MKNKISLSKERLDQLLYGDAEPTLSEEVVLEEAHRCYEQLLARKDRKFKNLDEQQKLIDGYLELRMDFKQREKVIIDFFDSLSLNEQRDFLKNFVGK